MARTARISPTPNPERPYGTRTVANCDLRAHITAAILWGFWLPLDLQRITVIHVSRAAEARAVRRAGDFLLKRRLPLSSPAKLQAAVTRMSGRRGVLKACEALEWIRERTDSAKETEIRLLLLRAALPEPGINCAVLDANSAYLEEPDMTYPKFKIALQYDGGHHISEDQRRWDIFRDERIIEVGWRVLKLTQLDLNQPHSGGKPSVVSRTCAALIQRSWKRSAGPALCPGPSSRPVKPDQV